MHPLAELAKSAVEIFVRDGKVIKIPGNIPRDYLDKNAGVFVTIKRDCELRGCIGTYAPTQKDIAQETIFNAIEAASGDPRFEPVKEAELNSLDYEVYILGEPEQIKSPGSLDPRKYGIIVTGDKSLKKGLLLPGLDGIDTIDEQLSAACQKAGIDITQEELIVYRFQAEKLS